MACYDTVCKYCITRGETRSGGARKQNPASSDRPDLEIVIDLGCFILVGLMWC
jgi:hypothetical protein